jgi:flagellar hook-associated protein 1 FlgK
MSSGLMNIGLRAMIANSAALQVTGHNIANANVEGYSRQGVVLATNTGQFTGAGFFGKGSSVVDVRRAHDEFLTAQVQASRALSSMDAARATQLSQLEDVFPGGSTGVGAALGDFLNAMSDLGNAPADGSARQVVLARAADVAARFSTAAERIEVLQAGVRSDLESSAKTVNGLAADIADLNQAIASVWALDQKPNDLLDQRDQLVSRLSQYMKVTTIQASDGSLGVFIAGGQRLVLGTQASLLSVGPDPADPTRAALSLETGSDVLPLGDGLISGGSMAGLMRFQNEDLVDARNQLGQMAMAFATKVNNQQAMGLDLGDPPGAGSALFKVTDPVALPNRNNARDGSGALIASVSLSIDDATLLQASDYELINDTANPGQYLLTRLSDGLSRTISDGDTVDGFTVSVPLPGLQAGDRFLLQPVGHAASNMTRALDDPNGIAAAAPVTATVGASNKGTASIASLKVTSPSIDPSNSVSITFSTDSGDYDYSITDAFGNVVETGSGTWTPGQPIALNDAEINLNGVPKAGDTIDMVKTQYPATNNGNALQMAALRDERFVGRTVLSGGSIAEGATLTDAYANTMADIGVRVQSAKTASQISTAAATQAETTMTSKAGVNLDEEAARLLQFQQSYQAAAKVLQVAQQVFDTMLQLTQ